ncbi:MAG TPA: FAD-binding oxidoreductase [Thermodesulfobacteriota bacterium]|nr:FAD-binding oxidoreductase [Thermodesulfobacteriota bacterium]
MGDSAILKTLAGIVGGENAVPGDGAAEFSVGGVAPRIVLFPGTVEEVSEIMKAASRDSLSVIPMGSNTKRGLGDAVRGADVALSVKRLNRILEHESADLVATAECGMTLAALQEGLGGKGQFLPVDPPHVKEGATLGGIIASGDSGPERLRYGTARELLIGMKAVRADGTVFNGGAKVVKNVAGYDLPKLFVGSLGTLGILVEATFRLYPVPEYSRTCIAGFGSLEDSQAAVHALLNSDLVMTSLEHLTPALAGAAAGRADVFMKRGSYHLAVRIANVEKAVRDQMEHVTAILGGHGAEASVVEGRDEDSFWSVIREFPGGSAEEGRAVLKAGVVISEVPSVFKVIEMLREGGVEALASARAGNGIIMIELRGGDQALAGAIDSLRMVAESGGGTLVINDASPGVKSAAGVWGDLGSGYGLMKRIKSGYDPLDILNPGRLV